MQIKIENISYQVAKQAILKNISCTIPSGQLTVLLGANGAGKSTLLKIMAAQESMTKGIIYYNNRNIKTWSVQELAKYRAVLSQHIYMGFPMSVMEVVMLGRYPSMAKNTRTEHQKIVLEALEEVGLSAFAKRDIQSLSGGEQQRVHMARVLAQSWNARGRATEQIIFLDEPTASLDINYQHELLALAQKLCRKYQFTVVVVLHDMNLAAQYANQILMLKKGKLLTFGEPEKILIPNTIKEAFGVEAFVQKHPVFNCLQVTTYQNNQKIAL